MIQDERLPTSVSEPRRKSRPARWAFGVCIGPSGKYDQHAAPSIARYGGSDALFTVRGSRSLFAAYNEILSRACQSVADYDGIILMHDDVELREDPRPKLNHFIERDHGIGVIGLLGARHPSSLAWWRFEKYGRLPDYRSDHDWGRGEHAVDVVDDPIIAIPRSAMERIRFPDGRYTGFEGLGVIACTIARTQGFEVSTTDFDIMHHNSGDDYNSLRDWRKNELRWLRDYFALTRRERASCLLREIAIPLLPLRLAVLRLAASRRLWQPRQDAFDDTPDIVINHCLQQWHDWALRFQGREIWQTARGAAAGAAEGHTSTGDGTFGPDT
jgi:hypothetical protein